MNTGERKQNVKQLNYIGKCIVSNHVDRRNLGVEGLLGGLSSLSVLKNSTSKNINGITSVMTFFMHLIF